MILVLVFCPEMLLELYSDRVCVSSFGFGVGPRSSGVLDGQTYDWSCAGKGD